MSLRDADHMLHRFHYRQPYDDAGPLADLALQLDHAAIGHDDALTHREPKPDARAGRFGSEKRIEHPLQMLLGYADAIIDDADDYVALLLAILRRVVLCNDADRPALMLGRISGVE